jgi:hypothetical protein
MTRKLETETIDMICATISELRHVLFSLQHSGRYLMMFSIFHEIHS